MKKKRRKMGPESGSNRYFAPIRQTDGNQSYARKERDYPDSRPQASNCLVLFYLITPLAIHTPRNSRQACSSGGRPLGTS